MAAMDEIAIALQGRNPEANRHRSWRVEAGRDLFGAWIVRVTFGRIGCRGRTFAREFGSEDEARAYVRDGLRRRKGAHSALRGRISRRRRLARRAASLGDGQIIERP